VHGDGVDNDRLIAQDDVASPHKPRPRVKRSNHLSKLRFRDAFNGVTFAVEECG